MHYCARLRYRKRTSYYHQDHRDYNCRRAHWLRVDVDLISATTDVQVDERDWNTVTAFLYLEDSSTETAMIGMNEKQGLSCATVSDKNSSAYIVLEFMGNSATVKANATISDLRLLRSSQSCCRTVPRCCFWVGLLVSVYYTFRGYSNLRCRAPLRSREKYSL